jgi:hypothetical protein
MEGMISPKISPPVANLQNIMTIRQKFREVFGCDATLNDDALARNYRVTGDGDLIMILR